MIHAVILNDLYLRRNEPQFPAYEFRSGCFQRGAADTADTLLFWYIKKYLLNWQALEAFIVGSALLPGLCFCLFPSEEGFF